MEIQHNISALASLMAQQNRYSLYQRCCHAVHIKVRGKVYQALTESGRPLWGTFSGSRAASTAADASCAIKAVVAIEDLTARACSSEWYTFDLLLVFYFSGEEDTCAL
jgi:hypothetical protein